MFPPEFDAGFETARFEIFRLETLQEYRSPGGNLSLEDFLAGRPYQPTPGRQEWTGLIEAAAGRGCAMRRVHVVTEPLTNYARYELTWGYAPSVAAGEGVYIISVPEGTAWPAEVPRLDFWLFDSSALWVMHYDEDTVLTGVERVVIPDAIVHARDWRDHALLQAVPWREYIDARPALAQQLPAVARRAS